MLNKPVIDCHMHLDGINGIGNMLKIFDKCSLKAANILVGAILTEQKIERNIAALLLKSMYPDKFYVFGGLDYYLPDCPKYPQNLLKQAKTLKTLGVDGMKMIEGKPNIRKQIGVALDSTIYDKYYSFLQEEGIPILFHVADPDEFWNENLVSDHHKSKGWFYGDGTFPSKESLYQEIDRLLDKFPRLKIVFAHFYFLANHPDKASDFLDKWPNTYLDVTPGIVIYPQLAQIIDKWKDFFLKYQDRILFGTDNFATNTKKDINSYVKRYNNVRYFLENEGEFDAWGTKLKGLGLKQEVLEKIYILNFEQLVGKKPKPVLLNLLKNECENLLSLASQKQVKEETICKIKEVIKNLE